MSTNRVATNSHSQPNKLIEIYKKEQFERILRGTLNEFRFLGIPLDHSSIRSPVIRCCAISFGLFMFISQLIANITVLISEAKNFQFGTKYWNRSINEGNFSSNLMFITGMVSTMIHILRRRSVNLISINHIHGCRCYGLLVELVHQINRSFGPFLLAVLVYYFIFLVNGTFYAFSSFIETGLSDSATWLPFLVEIGIFPIFLFGLYVPSSPNKTRSSVKS